MPIHRQPKAQRATVETLSTTIRPDNIIAIDPDVDRSGVAWLRPKTGGWSATRFRSRSCLIISWRLEGNVRDDRSLLSWWSRRDGWSERITTRTIGTPIDRRQLRVTRWAVTTRSADRSCRCAATTASRSSNNDRSGRFGPARTGRSHTGSSRPLPQSQTETEPLKRCAMPVCWPGTTPDYPWHVYFKKKGDPAAQLKSPW